MTSNDDPLLGVGDVLRRAALKARSTVMIAVRSGELAPHQETSVGRLFLTSEVDRWIAAREAKRREVAS